MEKRKKIQTYISGVSIFFTVHVHWVSFKQNTQLCETQMSQIIHVHKTKTNAFDELHEIQQIDYTKKKKKFKTNGHA